jgi:UDP-GlcNAc:undecaprenyl-phosphate/decaprenyl-phosphate GlcNAc-1-phosphate transferase
MREYALVLLVTAAVTYLLTPLVRRVAIATRAIHEPRARDTHTKPTPLLGGLAMYGGLVAGLLLASRLSFVQDPFRTAGSRSEAGLLLAGGLVVLVGFADDRWGLSAISRLAAQVAAAGILVWSGQALPWLPLPNGGVFSLEPDLSVTLTILLVVVTMNAINFIDGLDGLAAGIVAVAALSFLAYSYTLIRTIHSTSQSLPAVASALLAGMCIGFLPHNFYPARIFMGDIGAMLLGLLLAYGPISSTDSLDPALLTNYSQPNTLDRFPTFLPLLVPAAIFIIPYADLMFAVIRRTRAGQSIMAADRQHLHHRLLNIGHSYRQSVLLMYLWAALFSVTVVSLSIVRTPSVVFFAATLVAVLALLPATMPSLRPWRSAARNSAARNSAAGKRAAPGKAANQAASSAAASAAQIAAAQVAAARSNPVVPNPAGPTRAGPDLPRHPAPGPAPSGVPVNGATPAADPLPRAGRLSGADPFPGQSPFATQDPFPAQDPFTRQDPFPDPSPFPDHAAFPGREPFQGEDPFQTRDPFPGQDPFSGWAPARGQDPFQRPDPFPGSDHVQGQDPFQGLDQSPRPAPVSGPPSFSGTAPFPQAPAESGDDPADDRDPFPPGQRPDARPR